jgi:hypothetical protein
METRAVLALVTFNYSINILVVSDLERNVCSASVKCATDVSILNLSITSGVLISLIKKDERL